MAMICGAVERRAGPGGGGAGSKAGVGVNKKRAAPAALID